MAAALSVRPGGLLVVSRHEAPDGAGLSGAAARLALREMAGRAGALRAAVRPEALVLKLAAPASSAGAALDLAAAGAEAPGDAHWAPVALGPAGRWLRILARLPAAHAPGRPLSALAYAAGGAALPGPDLGQLALEDMLSTYRAHLLGAATRRLGIAGWPLSATWSPALHSRTLPACGVDAVLVPLPCRDADEIARVAEALALEGLAVTMPHKEAAARLAARRCPRVQRSGVANTLRLRDGAWEAESFDGDAVVSLLAAQGVRAGARVVVVGAGGAARAAAAELLRAGLRVTLVARRDAEASGVARDLAERAGGAAPCPAIEAAPWARLESGEIAASAPDALVQATPLGSEGAAPGAIPLEALQAPVVLDMVTTPHETALLTAQRRRGAIAVDGLAMLAHQAAAQQRWWLEDGEDAARACDAATLETVLREMAAGHG